MRVLAPDTKVARLSLFRSIDAGITVRGSIGTATSFPVSASRSSPREPDATADSGSRSTTITLRVISPTLARLEDGPAPFDGETVRRAKVHAHALFAAALGAA